MSTQNDTEDKSTDRDASETIDDPSDHAAQAYRDAAEEIADAPDDMIEGPAAVGNATQNFVEDMAGALDAGLPEAEKNRHCGNFADLDRVSHTKTDLKGLITERTAELDAEAGLPLDQYIEENLDRVVAVRTTDANQSALYQWVFEGGDVTVQTGPDQSTSHLDPFAFREAIFNAGGPSVDEPSPGVAEDWIEHVHDVIEDGEVTTERGKQTQAVDSLRNYVARTKAYPEIEHMIDHNGVRLDADPEDGDPSEVWVDASEISRICEDHAVSGRGLQVELDVGGYTVDRISGVSEETFVKGERFTYWVLSTNLADPAGYEADPETAIERQERKRDENRQDSEESDSEPGQLGSVGAGGD